MAKLPERRVVRPDPLASPAAVLVVERAQEVQTLRRKLTNEYQARYAHFVPEWEIHDLGHDIASEVALAFNPRLGSKITSYYWFLFERRIVSLLEKHGHCKCPGCHGKGVVEGENCTTCESGWLHRGEVSTEAPLQIADSSAAEEPKVDPLTPFCISEEWLEEMGKTIAAVICLIREQLSEDKQIIWWANAMGRELSERDLLRLNDLKGGPMTEEAIRKARHDANKKVCKIRETVNEIAGAGRSL
jgi:hypothetical protein